MCFLGLPAILISSAHLALPTWTGVILAYSTPGWFLMDFDEVLNGRSGHVQQNTP